MKWTDEQLREAERLGAALMEKHKVATILQVGHHEFMEEMENTDSTLYQAYHRGLFKAEYELRESIIELAKGGSAAAQAESMKLLENLKSDI